MFIQTSDLKIFSWDPEYDKNRYINDGIDCHFLRHNFSAGEFSFRNRAWINLRLKLGIKIEKGLYVPQYFYDALGWADLIVVSGGDILADYGENAIKHYFFSYCNWGSSWKTCLYFCPIHFKI